MWQDVLGWLGNQRQPCRAGPSPVQYLPASHCRAESLRPANRTAISQGCVPVKPLSRPAAVCSSATKSHFRFSVLFSYLDNFGFIVKYNALTVEGLRNKEWQDLKSNEEEKEM